MAARPDFLPSAGTPNPFPAHECLCPRTHQQTRGRSGPSHRDHRPALGNDPHFPRRHHKTRRRRVKNDVPDADGPAGIIGDGTGPEGNGERGVRIGRDVLALPSGVTLSFSNAAGLLGIVALCIFAAQTAQEYTYGTLRNLLVRQPSRMKILIGKLGSMKLFAIAMVALSALLAVTLSYVFAGVMDIPTTAWSTQDAQIAVIQTFVNVLLATIGFGIFGMILGLLFRSPISAISIGVIWNLIIEGLLSVFINDIDRYFPGQLLSIVASGGNDRISYQYALFTSYGFLLAGLAIVAFLFKRRDVSN